LGRRFNKENTFIFEEKLEQFTGKTYPMGIEEFLLHRAEMKGEKRGEKRAEKEFQRERASVIRNARLKGLSIELISDIVNLPAEKIRQILDEMGIE
jgi:hypothetical protein